MNIKSYLVAPKNRDFSLFFEYIFTNLAPTCTCDGTTMHFLVFVYRLLLNIVFSLPSEKIAKMFLSRSFWPVFINQRNRTSRRFDFRSKSLLFVLLFHSTSLDLLTVFCLYLNCLHMTLVTSQMLLISNILG